MHDIMLYRYERDDPYIVLCGMIPYFSDKELEVAELSMNGKSDDVIARELKITPEQLEEIRTHMRTRMKEILGSS